MTLMRTALNYFWLAFAFSGGQHFRSHEPRNTQLSSSLLLAD